MRALIVTTWYPDHSTPSRTPFCHEHVLALQAAGHDVRVIHVCREKLDPASGQELFDGISVTRVSLVLAKPQTWVNATIVIARALRKSDILHTMAFSSILVAAPAWSLSRKSWVHTEHWNGVIDPASVGATWRRMSWLRHALRLPHKVTAVTEQLATAIQPYARQDAVSVVGCVVHPAAKHMPYPDHPPLQVIAVGLLNTRKDPLLALDTILLLRGQGVDARLTWVGDGPLRVDFESRIRQEGLAAVVNAVGAVPPAAVSMRLELAHVFFVPSRQENFFTAAAESIAAGRPVVVPRSGGFVDYCDESNSVIAEDRSVKNLADAILKAFDLVNSTTPDRVSASLNGLFDPISIGSKFNRIYHDVMMLR